MSDHVTRSTTSSDGFLVVFFSTVPLYPFNCCVFDNTERYFLALVLPPLTTWAQNLKAVKAMPTLLQRSISESLLQDEL